VLDLFERRFQVFQDLTQTIADAFNKPEVQITDLASFDAATEKARFLFGPEVHGYLKQIRVKLIDVHTVGHALSQLPDGELRTRAEAKVSEALAEKCTPFTSGWRKCLRHI